MFHRGDGRPKTIGMRLYSLRWATDYKMQATWCYWVACISVPKLKCGFQFQFSGVCWANGAPGIGMLHIPSGGDVVDMAWKQPWLRYLQVPSITHCWGWVCKLSRITAWLAFSEVSTRNPGLFNPWSLHQDVLGIQVAISFYLGVFCRLQYVQIILIGVILTAFTWV